MRWLALSMLLLTVAACSQMKISIPGASGPGAGDQVVAESDVSKTVECHNETVFLRGNKDKITLTGSCGAVQIIGDGNTVNIERSKQIVVSGNDNTVTYRYPNTGVNVPGKNNHVNVERTDQ